MYRGLLVVLTLCLPLTFPGASSAWDLEIVDSGGVGAHSALQVGPDDRVHISYMANSYGYLKYATFDGMNWSSEIADPTFLCGQFTSLAVDSSGDPHIAYLYYSGRCIRYAHKVDGAWTYSDVDIQPDMEYDISMALDSDNHPHIAYWNGTFYGEANDLGYAVFDGANWTTIEVDSPGQVGRGASIALDSYDFPAISYYDETNTALKFAHWTGTQWDVITVDDIDYISFNFRTAIAVDSQDRVHIAYSAYEYDEPNWVGQLKYAMRDAEGWHVSVVEDHPSGRDFRVPAITLDSSDNPHISYVYYYNQEPISADMKYAVPVDGYWQTQFVDEGDIADSDYSNGIDLDSGERPHISYCESGVVLKHAELADPAAVADPPGSIDDAVGSPAGLRLAPNPARGSAVATLVLEEDAFLSLDIYDAAGRWVKNVTSGQFSAGIHPSEVGRGLAPGVYFIRLRFGSTAVTRKLVLSE